MQVRSSASPSSHWLAGVHLAMDYLYGRNRWVAAHQGRLTARSPTRSPPRAAALS